MANGENKTLIIIGLYPSGLLFFFCLISGPCERCWLSTLIPSTISNGKVILPSSGVCGDASGPASLLSGLRKSGIGKRRRKAPAWPVLGGASAAGPDSELPRGKLRRTLGACVLACEELGTHSSWTQPHLRRRGRVDGAPPKRAW